MKKVYSRLISFAAVVAVLWAPTARGQQQTSDIVDLDLEQLMALEVTSVTKTEKKVAKSPAAVFIITREDIRHSGMSSVPELLRLVPGLDVAHIDGSEWAVSSRGFNARYANKLLVLIDGRSLYSLSTEAVYWELQHVMLEDIDRIEVIRGPGATLWGAGAVNGVINIIMKPAADTQGGLLSVSGGSQEHLNGALRYGGQTRHGSYRVYGIGFERGSFAGPSGSSGRDDWNIEQMGARADLDVSQRDTLMLSGRIFRGTQDQVKVLTSFTPPYDEATGTATDLLGGNASATWKKVHSERSTSTFRFYFDNYSTDSPAMAMTVNSFNFDFENRFQAATRHELVWGGEYRQTRDAFDSSKQNLFTPARHVGQLFGGFLQDNITIVPDALQLSAGLRVDHAPFTSALVEPNIRLLWTPNAKSTYWASYSMTERAPDRAHRGLDITPAVIPPFDGLPAAIKILGSNNTRSERIETLELGTRFQVTRRISLDVATFASRYADVQTFTAGAPFVTTTSPAHLILPTYFSNDMQGHGYGGELFATFKVTPKWKLMGGYSFDAVMLSLKPGASAGTAEMPAGRAPRHQLQLRSQLDVTNMFEFDHSLYFVGRLTDPTIPAYTRVDVRAAWHLSPAVDLSIVGQNLLRPAHLEFVDTSADASTQDVRKAALKLNWRF